MVRNRSFHTQAYWTLVTQGSAVGTMSVDASQPLNTNIPSSLKLTMQSGTGSVGAGNAGFWGMSLQAGATYYLNFYAMGSNGFGGPVVAQLQNAGGSTVYAQASFTGLTAGWQKFAAPLVSSGTDTNARIVLSITNAGTVWLDVVSLFPAATFDNRTNGLRSDLANMLAALHPSFLRFPGGNFIEGATSPMPCVGRKPSATSRNDRATWTMPGVTGPPTGLATTNSCSFAKTWACSRFTPSTAACARLQRQRQQHRSAVTNGAVGAGRARCDSICQRRHEHDLGRAAGRQRPSRAVQSAIPGNRQRKRRNLLQRPLHAVLRCHQIELSVHAFDCAGQLVRQARPWSRPVEIQDEHYYASPATFYSYATKYDSYSRNGPKVFVGEYAVTSGYGTYGNLVRGAGRSGVHDRHGAQLGHRSNGLLCAAVGELERHTSGIPDLIYYDSSRGMFGTPSYYVQELFGQNRGDVVLPTVVSGTTALYASSSLLPFNGQIIVKVVNANNAPLATTFNVAGVNTVASNATVIQLTSSSSTDGNSLASPAYVFPVTNSIANAGTNFTLTLPANSLSILRLNASGLNSCTNLLLQFPSPIDSGQQVAATVSGQESGNWINLTTNANHAITYTSADTSIAVVDGQGNITGVGPGTTSIMATYASLGLSVTQSLQVVYAPTTLVHRYSFNDGTANDSVGSANGTLVGNATISGGQLVLPNTTSVAPATDYLQLPAGILTNSVNGTNNAPAVTVEAWATVKAGQYTWANLFDFGNRDAGGLSEYDIHVCVHANDNSTIAGISDSDNANVDYQFVDLDPGSSLDGSTNVHITAVFNPPAGYVAIYLNGVLAGADNNVTIPMSGVQAVRNIIGADNWPDPGMQGSIDEFRIYNGALTADEIAATQVLGPNQLLSTASPAVSASASGGSLTLSWPVASAGYSVLTTTNLAAGNWMAAVVTPQIVGSRWQVILPVTGNTRFYRLQK